MLQPGLPAAAASEGGGGTGADPALSKKAARRAEKAAAAKKRGASGPALEGGGRQQRKAKQQVARLEGGVVCVAGGGIGGLGAALALQKRGIAVKVYERDVSLLSRPQGYGMTLSTTNTALEELGLLEELRERDTTSSSHYVFAANGEILGYFGGAFQPSRPQTGERGNLRVPRQILRQMLLSRLKPGTVRWGTEVMHFEEIEAKKADSATKRQTGAGAAVSAPPPASAAPPAAAAAAAPTASAGKVDVTLSDGAVEQFDVLIGAEGIRSRIRSMKVKDTLKYLGVMAVVGTSPMVHPLLQGRGFYTLDGTHRLFTMPYQLPSADGTQPPLTMWQLTFRMEEADAAELARKPAAQILAEIMQRCQGWHDPVLPMIECTDPSIIWAHPLYDRDPMPPPPKGKKSLVTLLGDAAHPMSCFKGQGANTALFDAPHLVNLLTTLPTPSAVAVYEREMVARSSKRVLASREAAVSLHCPAVLEDGNFAIAGVPTEQADAVAKELKAKNVGAWCAGSIDARVAEAIAATRA